jgi:hypothetical protein
MEQRRPPRRAPVNQLGSIGLGCHQSPQVRRRPIGYDLGQGWHSPQAKHPNEPHPNDTIQHRSTPNLLNQFG